MVDTNRLVLLQLLKNQKEIIRGILSLSNAPGVGMHTAPLGACVRDTIRLIADIEKPAPIQRTPTKPLPKWQHGSALLHVNGAEVAKAGTMYRIPADDRSVQIRWSIDWPVGDSATATLGTFVRIVSASGVYVCDIKPSKGANGRLRTVGYSPSP